MSGIAPGIEPNDGWRSKPISQKQAEYLHDLSCAMFAMMSRGEASDMIARMLEAQKQADPLINVDDYLISGDDHVVTKLHTTETHWRITNDQADMLWWCQPDWWQQVPD